METVYNRGNMYVKTAQNGSAGLKYCVYIGGEDIPVQTEFRSLDAAVNWVDSELDFPSWKRPGYWR
jgi:hypothetical protein